jgi:hypothetical protein
MNPSENQQQPNQAWPPTEVPAAPQNVPAAAAPPSMSPQGYDPLYPNQAAPGVTAVPTNSFSNPETQAPASNGAPAAASVVPSAEYLNQPVAPTPVVVAADPVAAFAPVDPPKPKKSWLKRLAIGFGVVVVMAVLGLGAFLAGPILRGKLQASDQTSALKKLQSSGSGVTAATVAKLDPTNTFFAVWAHTAQQQVVTTTSSYSYSDSASDNSEPADIRQVGFNYASKQFSYRHDAPSLTGGAGPDENRCLGPQEYYYLSSFASSGWQKSDDSNDCMLKALPLEGLNDGLNAGGLTSAQADTFVRSLRKTPGLVTVNGLKLATVQGRSLLRFEVTVKPVKSSQGYFGMQYFMWSFKDTGVDPSALPYTYLGAGGDGAHFAYYVDPGTQLPVYSQIVTTPHLNDSGKPDASDQTYDFYHVEYHFGGDLPQVNITDTSPLKLQWPSEKL